SGVVLTGGGDVQPSIYGAETHPTFSAAEEGRDEYELELARLAIGADLPLLAICRGVQVLNVAQGGTLVQDIPSELPTAIAHRFAVPPHEPTSLAHEIRIEHGARLFQLLAGMTNGTGRCPVNSRHHQALNAIGNGLIATARAADDVVEALEDPSRRF